MDGNRQVKALIRQANELAKAILAGDKKAVGDLELLIARNPSLKGVIKRLQRQIDRESGWKASGPTKKARGSVMHGLAGKTAAKSWRTTK